MIRPNFLIHNFLVSLIFVSSIIITSHLLAFPIDSSHLIDFKTDENDSLLLIRTFDPSINLTFSYPNTIDYSPARDAGIGRLLWSASDNNAIAGHVALSEDGRWLAIGMTLNDERLEVRSAESGQLQFAYPVESGSSYVAISSDGSIIAFAAMDSVWVFNRDQGANPVMRFGMNHFGAGPLTMSRSGTFLYATGVDPQGIRNRIFAFQNSNPEPIWTAEVPNDESLGWYGLTLSKDGTTLAANGKYHLYVYRSLDGNLIWHTQTFNTESNTALSGDGSILATASLAGRLRIFVRDEEVGYRLLWHYNFGGALSTWVSTCAVSEDGRTVVAGTLDFHQDRYEGRVALFETYGNGEPVWISQPLSDEISRVDLSEDGTTIAATSWGDLNNNEPDLLIFERHSNIPFYTLNTNGSLDGLTLTPDGTLCSVSGKGVHNRVFGRGGQVHTIDLRIIGGIVSGEVSDTDSNPIADVEITATDNPYRAITDRSGYYELIIETNDIRRVDISARCRGYQFGFRPNVTVELNERTEGIDLTLETSGHPPSNLRASQRERSVINLTWERYNEQQLNILTTDRLVIQTADGSHIRQSGLNETIDPHIRMRDNSDDADSIRIYRSYLPEGPFNHIASVNGDVSNFADRSHIFPQRVYYYAVSALFANGESRLSNIVIGSVDSSFLERDAVLQPMRNPPRIDGSIQDDEWQDAIVRDISDVFGYDSPDSAGSVLALLGFSDVSKQLFIGFKYFSLNTISERSGVGVYVDDDGNQRWSVDKPGSEGNYWGYWRNGSPDMRFRSLSGGLYTNDPYFRFDNSNLAFNDEQGYVEIEMEIPLGFRTPEQIALYAPDHTIGLGLFAIQRDRDDNTVFNGWWPQDIFSIVSNPEQFARITIPAQLTVPPSSPTGISVERNNDALHIFWSDPQTGIDNGQLNDWEGIRIYRNNEYLNYVAPRAQNFIDRHVSRGGWYEYSLAGYVIDDDGLFEGPRSQSVGNYAWNDPDVIEYTYDDGVAEHYFIVSPSGEDNRFATRFDILTDSDSAAIWWIDYYSGGTQPISLYLTEDNAGRPGQIIGQQFQSNPLVAGSFHRFHYPGLDQPKFAVIPGRTYSIWAVLNYLPNSPGAPAIGVDNSSSDNRRNQYFTSGQGWQGFNFGQLMIRIAVGRPVADTPIPEEHPLPTRFLVLSNYPNPFNTGSVVPVELPLPSPLELSIFDNNGRQISKLNWVLMPAGNHRLPINGSTLSTGNYLISIRSIIGTQQIRAVVIK